MAVQREAAIQQDVSEAKRRLYCDVRSTTATPTLHDQDHQGHCLNYRAEHMTAQCCILGGIGPTVRLTKGNGHCTTVRGRSVMAICPGVSRRLAVTFASTTVLMRPQTCRKQYKTAMEMETHLSSYDHHHTKVTRKAVPFAYWPVALVPSGLLR